MKEIKFVSDGMTVLLLIATSIGAATHNYLVTIILFLVVFASLIIQWLVRN